jgi:hypothetical protein
MIDILATQQRVKFAEPVWHDQAYEHPQLREIRQKDFYGRQDAVKRAKTTLQLSARPVIFIGERRAGKTSILKLILRALQSDAKYVTMEIPWLEVRSASALMRAILTSVYEKLDLTEPSLLDAFEKIHTPAEFRHSLQTLLKKTPDRMLVIGIDEFDSILYEQSEDEKKNIIGAIISLVETDEFPVKVVLTMTREPASIEVGYSSPLTTKSEKIRLEPFSKSETEEMLLGILENQIPISEQERKEIFGLSGGWPYFAKALLYHWIEFAGEDNALSLAKEKAVKDAGLCDAMEHIYLKHLNPSERTILLVTAKQGGKVTAKENSVLDVSIKAAAHELIKRGYLLAKDDGYVFRVALFQDWFSRWTRFEEQAQQYVTEILVAIERKKDPWAGVKSDDIFNGTADEEE